MSEENMEKKQSKMLFVTGLLAGVAIVSMIGFAITLPMAIKGKTGDSDSDSNKKVVATANTNVNAAAAPSPAPSPAPTQPTADTSKLSGIMPEDHVKGSSTAKVTMIEFSDFECPFCSRHTDNLNQLLKEFEGQVNLVFRHLPLSFHQYAMKAAQASECAGDQGKFWEMHDKIFETTASSGLNDGVFSALGSTIGLNAGDFESCMSSGKFDQKIQEDMAEARVVGVTGTPGTFINGQLVKGAIPLDDYAGQDGSMQPGLRSMIKRNL